MQQEALDK
jgi:hypothetical protein